jgi:branched-subunit amino acid aminotransferase/4-amino-4-deoxychorismate lyase
MTHAYLLGSAGFIADAGLPLTDRGFRYGMSVFETVAIRDRRPLLLEPHIQSLERSIDRVGFLPPEDWSQAVRTQTLAPPIAEGVVRIYVTAGDREGAESRIALIFETLPIPTALSTARAITVPFTPATPFGKTGNYWPHFLARPASGEEPILCAPDGALLGGAMANLFLVRDGKIFTPAAPIRHGVVRDWIGAAECPLTRADLATAEAAFLTNSRLGLCMLTALDGRELSGDPLVEKTWQRYRAEVLRVG